MIIDAHCDTLTVLKEQKRNFGELSTKGHLDLPRLKKAGIKIQFLAICVEKYRREATIKTLQIIDEFYKELEINHEKMELITSFEDVEKIIKGDKIGILLSLEGGEALSGEVSLLRIFYRLGVRSLGLTWNYRNELADGVWEKDSGGGLTRAGVEIIKEMNTLGMLVDLAHLSENGFKDVLKYAKKPFIVSHANCYALCEHKRNLKDWQIKECASLGGVIGVSYYPPFIKKEKASFDDLLDHIVHLSLVGGISCVGLGSDFDGIDEVILGLEKVEKVSFIAEGLAKRGFREDEIKAIMGENWLNLMKNIL